jgi:alpha-L-fucosidase
VCKDANTYWTTDDWVTAATIEFTLAGSKTFNVVDLGEHIHVGQRVESFVLEVPDGTGWKEFAKGTTIGYKRLLRFDPVTADRIRLRILDSRLCPTLARFRLYYAPPIETILGD